MNILLETAGQLPDYKFNTSFSKNDTDYLTEEMRTKKKKKLFKPCYMPPELL